MGTRGVRPPDPHPSGVKPPDIPPDLVPRHVALVMDGDGRWAGKRGLPRTEGHKQGESSLLDVIMGAIELGIPYLSAYAFSTENWRRSPDEVRFLMGFNRDVIHRRRDLLNEMGVRIRWAGRRPRLWRSVIRELEQAEQMSAGNSVLTLQFCVNYGGRAEIADAAAAIAADVVAGKIRADKIDEKVFARYLDEPSIPEVDLFVRSSGEQRLSNFLLWQSAYAELVFLDTLWPDFDRRHLWHACEIFASRDRRYGGAQPNPVAPGPASAEPAPAEPAPDYRFPGFAPRPLRGVRRVLQRRLRDHRPAVEHHRRRALAGRAAGHLVRPVGQREQHDRVALHDLGGVAGGQPVQAVRRQPRGQGGRDRHRPDWVASAVARK